MRTRKGGGSRFAIPAGHSRRRVESDERLKWVKALAKELWSIPCQAQVIGNQTGDPAAAMLTRAGAFSAMEGGGMKAADLLPDILTEQI